MVRGMAALTKNLAVITNVGDNIWLFGLYVCPDIDTITYGLAGLLDERRGWGIRGDSFDCLAQLRRLDAPSWFGLGDRDLATHIVRTSMLRQGKSLSEITDSLRRRYSIDAKIIPATDQELTTIIRTKKGEMHLQEFWVKYKGRPKVTSIKFDGSDSAIPNSAAISAIRRADMIIVAPANPVSSIGPTISLKGLRAELARKRKRVIAVSPLIGKKAISGPAAKYMRALGLENSPVGVAQYYQDFVGNFVISKSDHSMAKRIKSFGMDVNETNITMKDAQGEIRLARYLVNRFADK